MVQRWAAPALLMTELNFRKIMGYRNLWTLQLPWIRKCGRLQQKRP